MADPKKIRVGVNGFGVIGKRVAAAVASQEDMSLAGVSDVVTDWRAGTALRNGFRLFGATAEYACAMRAAGLDVTGTLDELLGQADVVVDCTPKRMAAKNIDMCSSNTARILNAFSRVCPEFVALSLRNRAIFRSKLTKAAV